MIGIDLVGRGALVCASSRGLGYAVARSFVEAGADVVICGRDSDALFRLAKKHDRDIFLSLCREQVDKRDFRLKPLVAMLEWLDG